MASSDSNEREKIMARIVVKAWTDPGFADRLKQNAGQVLQEEGLEFEKGGTVEVEFHIDTAEKKHLVIPTPPGLLQISKEHLLMIAAQRLSVQLELF